MSGPGTLGGRPGHRPPRWLALLACCGLACITVRADGSAHYRSVAGRFDTAHLERSLERGVSLPADVEAALGPAHGTGAMLLPGAERPCETWVYQVLDVAVGDEAQGLQAFLLVFFVDGRFDGFLWFADPGMTL